MKKGAIKIFVLLISCAAAVFAAGSAFSAAIQTDAETKNLAAKVNTDTVNAGYVIKSYNGLIALYTEGFNDNPAVVTDISVDSLRVYDKLLVDNGITVGTYEEVLRLFEDFSN